MLAPTCITLDPMGGQEAAVCSRVGVERVWIQGLEGRGPNICVRLSTGWSLMGSQGTVASPQLEASSSYVTMFQHRTQILRIKIISLESVRNPLKISLSKRINLLIPIA